ncbi:MurR/RpiR family transcriptional regulator [Streptomyces sp. NPDC057020]|uniref:MurR/RpiR family transcriptional regulator n=1 Tax=unclassified Streptomyces TaxID=2593676 RepID=UPI0009404F30|nr:MurR/RpiR family transcriptional regulator [Streptomyces sp. CB02009]OKJ48987.1 RpiR family transcriptional regulator [Streptomyces sp. CB02009]
MVPSPIADDIRRKLGILAPAERKVARILLASYPSAGFETVATIAERANVSAPTVLRFVARLGYTSFPDFQAALRKELDDRSASPISLYETAADSAHGQSTDGLVAYSSTLFTKALTHTLTDIPRHDFAGALALLSDPRRRVTLVGGRFTHLLARYLGLHLMQLRDDIRFLPDRDVERTSLLAALTKRDVLVIFDYRRYENDKLAIAQLAKDSGGKVIVFTDMWLSPTSTHADVVLSHRVDTPSPYDSLVPTLAVVETLVAALVTALGDGAHRHMKQGEETARRVELV